MSFDLGKAMAHTLILLSGEEEYLRREALTQVLQAATAEDDFDLEKVMADASDPQDWLASAGTAPFLSERRTVVVRNVLRQDEVKGFADQFVQGVKALPSSALLVLVADEESGDENRQKRFQRARKSWEDLVKKAGGYVEVFKLEGAGLRPALKTRANSLGKPISDRAADLLIEMTGGNLSRAYDELDKLILFAGDEKQIQESDVRDVVVPSREWNVFKMVDAIVAGDAAEALRQLRIVVSSAAKAEEIGFRSLLPMLSRQLRLIWQARICVEARTDPVRAPGEVTRWFPQNPNLSSAQEWQRNKSMNAARSISFDQLSKLIAMVCDADARLKGQLASFSGADTLERMTLEMVGLVRGARKK
jgi:DNA polymerase III subunit delta